ncbi:MAG: hypothetical protein H7Z75_23330, partial [Ferruginibacter sp.]|nr:hypothetical protein [Cytophagales bacterium]
MQAGVALAMLLTSCEDRLTENQVKPTSTLPVAPDYRKSSDPEMARNLRQASLVLARLTTMPEVVEEIEWGIRSGYYHDESILLKDLLKPAESKLYNDPARKYAGPRSFATKFREVLESSNYPHAEEFQPRADARTASLPYEYLVDYFVQHNVQIYFPYSEEFGGETPDFRTLENRITTTSDPVDPDNEDENTGWIPYQRVWKPDRKKGEEGDPEIIWDYAQVLVNDDYAFT